LIVTCEQCATQFHLDDAKVPPGGVRVRCSRCKHAFFIEPAGEAPELGGADQAVQDALHEQAPLAPEAAEDLSESDSALDDGEDLASESDWEFNRSPFGADTPEEGEPPGAHDAAREAIDDLLDSRGSSARAAAVLTAPRNPLAPVGEQQPLAASAFDAEDEELGSPESWDLLGGDSPSPADAGERLPREASGQTRAPVAHAQLRELPPSLAEWIPPREPSIVLAWIARMGHAIGWSVTAILFSIVAILTLAPAADPDSEAQFGRQRLAGLEAQGISGRWVENAVSGSLYVVSGRLVNPTAQPAVLGTRVGVRLLDANGSRLPVEIAAAGPVVPERDLREADPAGLQARQQEAGLALAAELIQPGQSVAFEAVVAEVPSSASRFLLEPFAATRSAPPANAGDPAPRSQPGS
jgi:predicted Zn finger-like uncharacterized protein